MQVGLIRLPALGVVLALCSIGCAAPEPWEPTDLTAAVEEALVSRDVKTVLSELRLIDPAPNLYDLHHPSGALARVRRLDGRLVLEILEKAGYDAELDDMEGGFRFAGERRVLWIGFDFVDAQIPATLRRFSLPSGIALITVNADGEVRATRAVHPMQPFSLSEVQQFARHWVSEAGVSADADPSPKIQARPGPEIRVEEGGGLKYDGEVIEAGALAERLRGLPEGPVAPAVWIRPSPGATYGDWVAVLDQVYRVAGASPGLGVALPSAQADRYGTVVELRSERLEEPVMVLKADVRAPWKLVSDVLDVLRGVVPEVVLLTHLDVSNPELIGEETYPGGLPGGLPLSLEPIRDGSADLVAEKAMAERRRLQDRRSPGASPTTGSWGGSGVEPRLGVLERRRRAIEERRNQARSAPSRSEEVPDEPGHDEGDGQPVHIGGDVARPEKLFMPEPQYTASAREARIQGVVIAQVVIDERGNVIEAKILKGLPMGLSEAALEAARASRWKPATRQGRPVKVYYNLTLNFRLVK
ncbi:MAG: energy transducer TonB [Holophagales bacterium]|nr:energy transducer TonB [Holophagales bacterium]